LFLFAQQSTTLQPTNAHSSRTAALQASAAAAAAAANYRYCCFAHVQCKLLLLFLLALILLFTLRAAHGIAPACALLTAAVY
jgi:hypothetical protein